MSAVLDYPGWDAPSLTIDPLLESERLQDLLSLNLLDTEPEDRFDRITRLAAEFFGIPIAYVALIDSDRQWLKSSVGLERGAMTERRMSFCQYTIHRDEPLVILDTNLHPVAQKHPLVVGAPFIRFYAGIPLAGPRGQKIGTLCLVDTLPRQFTEEQLAALVRFGALVEREFSLGEIIHTQNELLNTRTQLIQTQKELEQELADAAKYVRMMLPPALDGPEIIDWQFHPSTHLGGDGLGYRQINDDQIAFYILDVTGHGLGSALLAVTALELLRNRNPASGMDFASPRAVIERLNRTFQMKEHAGKFFSVWYGVYSRSRRKITYANAGHPPPVLLARQSDDSVRVEKTEHGNSVLGIMPEIVVREKTIDFPATSELFLFTDGLYELLEPGGGRGSYDEFMIYLQAHTLGTNPTWEAALHWLDRARKKHMLDDDVSLLRFSTRA